LAEDRGLAIRGAEGWQAECKKEITANVIRACRYALDLGMENAKAEMRLE